MTYSRRIGARVLAAGSIWRSGRDLFHLVDCDDLPTAFARLERDPANERWQAFIAAYVNHLETPYRRPDAPRVWWMGNQRSP